MGTIDPHSGNIPDWVERTRWREVECDRCGGSGYGNNADKCQECNGSGVVSQIE